MRVIRWLVALPLVVPFLIVFVVGLTLWVAIEFILGEHK